jgi:hypothetical protein
MHAQDHKILDDIDPQYYYGKDFFIQILTLKFFSAVMFLLFLQAFAY